MFQVLKKWWKSFARALGWFNTRFLLTLFYVIGLSIPAIILKLLRKDLLDRKFRDRESYWRERKQEADTFERAKHQF